MNANAARDDDDRRSPKGTKKDREERKGSVEAEDRDLADWLHKLWARGEPPSRIELWQAFGPHADRGEMIFHEDFKPNEKLSVEAAVILSNAILREAQVDTDHSPRRKTFYVLSVTDLARKASPLVRRVGPFYPQTRHLLDKHGDPMNPDDEEEDLVTGKSLSFKYAGMLIDQLQRERHHNSQIQAGVLMMMERLQGTLFSRVEVLFNTVSSIFSQMQDAADRSLDREDHRKWSELKREFLADGFRLGRSLVPGMLTSGDGKNPAMDDVAIRTLVDNFLTDCEKTGASIPLFGNWEEKGGAAVCTSPGILSEAQFLTLLGVCKGKLPTDRLDALTPGSGKPEEITQEQMMKAMPMLTQGTQASILEIFNLRKKRAEALVKQGEGK